MTQLRVAMIYYLLLVCIKYQTRIKSYILYLHRKIKEALMAKLNFIDLLGLLPSRIKQIKNIEFQFDFW